MTGFTFSLQPGRQATVGQPIRVQTANYLLRSITAADVTPEFVTWFNDPTMLLGLNIQALNFSMDGLRSFAASFDNHHNFLIGVFDLKEQKLRGFFNFGVNHVHRICTLTMGMEPHSALARPILHETIGPLFDEMFDKAGFDKITARVLLTNRRVLFSLMDNDHFVIEGTLRQEIIGPDGKRLDVLAIACFKDLALRPIKKRPRIPATATQHG